MNFEVSSEYISALVTSAVQTPNASSGIDVQKVTLSEQGTGNQAVNQITLQFLPWERNPQGQPAVIGSPSEPWQLALTITPYLITPATVPDPATRTEILGDNNNEGVVLRFDFSNLNDPTGTQVTCSSATTTSSLSAYLDQTVIAGILTQLGSQSPFVVTTDQLTAIASQLTSSSTVDVNGVNIGSDGTLKLGFAFDSLPSCQGCQAEAPFDPTPFVTNTVYPGTDWDWNLDITQGFFTAAIQAQVTQQLTGAIPQATITSVTPTFSSSGIDLSIGGTANSFCGSFDFTVTTTVTPQVGADPNGQSVLQLPQTKPNFDPGTGQGFKFACWAVEQAFFGGWSIATIHQGGNCSNAVGGPVELSTASGDVLYGTGVNTEYDFVVLGRSKLLDQMDGVRTTVPPCT